MRVLIVYAHPEPKSFHASLCQVAVNELHAQGHEVKVSDLYAMNWKSQIDRDDFPNSSSEERLDVVQASTQGYTSQVLTEDVKAEQAKLAWADAVILLFPLWWFSMPAILKGWIDRVFSAGYAYGVGEHNEKSWGKRYGEGAFEGKRAMLIVSTGGWKDHYSPRGINGPMEDVLFPINHGVLFYPGFHVLPPFVTYQVGRQDEKAFATTEELLRERMRNLATTTPIAYRRQNFGDYRIPTMKLKEGVEKGDKVGFSLHIND
ncbi:Ribosyldihydronicotinamide dehydrogenase [Ilyonectria destructans]|nr:Ribosyldihydronicotinamide dehydrogenase [Ilyonectria destructans]